MASPPTILNLVTRFRAVAHAISALLLASSLHQSLLFVRSPNHPCPSTSPHPTLLPPFQRLSVGFFYPFLPLFVFFGWNSSAALAHRGSINASLPRMDRKEMDTSHIDGIKTLHRMASTHAGMQTRVAALLPLTHIMRRGGSQLSVSCVRSLALPKLPSRLLSSSKWASADHCGAPSEAAHAAVVQGFVCVCVCANTRAGRSVLRQNQPCFAFGCFFLYACKWKAEEEEAREEVCGFGQGGGGEKIDREVAL